MPFLTARDAKEFLVDCIHSQAQREGIPLSEVERKMLYFSETAWTLPDMSEVNKEFENHYDQGEFERKIAGLVRSIQRRPTADKRDKTNWDEAVRVLRSEDHYLITLIDCAGAARSLGDFARLILTAMAIVGALVAATLFLADRR